MKVYLVASHCEFEGIQDILKIFSDKRKAEDFVEDYNKNNSGKEQRREELIGLRNDNYFKKLEEQGILPGTPECINYPWEKAEEIDEEFMQSLNEYDRDCLYYFGPTSSETVMIIERELE